MEAGILIVLIWVSKLYPAPQSTPFFQTLGVHVLHTARFKSGVINFGS